MGVQGGKGWVESVEESKGTQSDYEGNEDEARLQAGGVIRVHMLTDQTNLVASSETGSKRY